MLTDEEKQAEFATLYRREFARLVVFLIYMGSSITDAQDAAQSAFVALYRDYDNVKNPRAWIRTVGSRYIARNHSSREIPTPEIPDEPVPNNDLVSEEAISVINALAKLPVQERRVMAWIIDGFTPTEIANIAGMNPSTVRSNLRNARKKLRENLLRGEPNH